MEQLPVLKKVFPDASVVITHRDPIAVIQSSVTMIAYGARMRLSRIDTEGLMQYWSDRIEHMLRACVRDRAAWSAAQSLDVFFHEFMVDEIGTVERIHALAGSGLRQTSSTSSTALVNVFTLQATWVRRCASRSASDSRRGSSARRP